MGIRSLLSFLAPIHRTGIDIMSLKGKTVIIDALYVLHQKLIGKDQHNSNIINNDGKDITHIDTLLNYTCGLLERGIRPVYVFDTKSPEEKGGMIESRKQKYISNDNNVEHGEYILEKSKIQESISFLKNIGVTVITSVGEADPDCAKIANMCYKNIGGVISNDSDMLLYNCPSMIDISFGKNRKSATFKKESKGSSVTFSEYNIIDVINYLNRKASFYRKNNNLPYVQFDHEDFVNFSIMLGTDYFYDKKKSNGIFLEYDDKSTQQCKVEHIDQLFKIFSIYDFSVKSTTEFMLSEKNTFVCNESGANFSFKVSENFMEIWEKTKNIYSNPSVTTIIQRDIDDYGNLKYSALPSYFGNISGILVNSPAGKPDILVNSPAGKPDILVNSPAGKPELYGKTIIDKIIKINDGNKIFRSVNNTQFNSNSFKSYSIKYIERRFKTSDFGTHNDELRIKLTSIFSQFVTSMQY